MTNIKSLVCLNVNQFYANLNEQIIDMSMPVKRFKLDQNYIQVLVWGRLFLS